VILHNHRLSQDSISCFFSSLLSLFFFRNEDIALFKLGGWERFVSACLTLCFYVFLCFLGLFLNFLGFMTMFLLDLE